MTTAAMTLRAYFGLIRPRWIFVSVVTVLIASISSSTTILRSEMILAVSVLALVLSAGFVLNDFFDLEIDRINAPNRPLPSGKIAPVHALFFGIGLYVAAFGLTFSWFESSFVYIFFLSFLGVIYSPFKQVTSVGANIITAVGVVLILLFAFSIGSVEITVNRSLFLICCFMLTMQFEAMYDIEDHSGDTLSGVRSEASMTSHEAVFGFATFGIGCTSVSIIFASNGSGFYSYLPFVMSLLISLIAALRLRGFTGLRHTAIPPIATILFILTFVPLIIEW